MPMFQHNWSMHGKDAVLATRVDMISIFLSPFQLVSKSFVVGKMATEIILPLILRLIFVSRALRPSSTD